MKHLLLILAMSISLMMSGQISVLPYNQPFVGLTMPADWSQIDHQGNGQVWQFGTDETSGAFWYPSPELDGNYAILNSEFYGEGSSQNVDLISPTFDLSAYSSVNLSFKHFFYYYENSAATFSYSIDNGSSWIEIKKWETPSSNPSTFVQVIPGIAGESQVKFKWNYVGSYEWGWAIDDVSVSEIKVALWEGDVSANWGDPGNWNTNEVPGVNSEVYIPGLTLYDPELSQIQPAECYQLTIVTGAMLTIDAGSSLTVHSNFINNSLNGLVIKSNVAGTGSLIAGSAVGAGTVEIERYMTGNQWHNIGSPVNQTISSFLINNTNIPTKNVVSRGMMDYNTSADNWNGFFTDDIDGNMEPGKGYSVRTTTDTHVTFSGTIATGQINLPLSTDGNRWNFVGNPYTSSIKLNDPTGTTSFLTINKNELDPNYVSLYIWTGAEYEVVNYLFGSENASLGQGFFVKSVEWGGNLIFTPEMQTQRPTTPLKAAKIAIPGIQLQVSSANKIASTDIKFHSKGTIGLDPGYDAGAFKSNPSFSVFTKLVNDNDVNFALQCLPELSTETLVIPVGIDFPEGGEVAFTAQMLNMPTKSSVLLEDRLMKTTTSFNNANSQYTAKIPANSLPTGRFYLHVSGNGQVTGIEKTIENKINAWMDRSEIVITGITENNAVATLFNIRGSSVMVKNLDKTDINRINVNGIPTGIYMLQVVENGKRTGMKLQISGN
jgi:hypothetical protein